MVVVLLTIVLTIVTIVLSIQNIRLRDRVALIDYIDKNTKSLLAIIDVKTMHAISASNSLLHVVGIDRKDIGNHSVRELIHPDDMQLLHSSIVSAREKEKKSYIKNNVFEGIRIRLRDVNYGWQWYEFSGFFTVDNGRQLLCCSYFPVNDQMRLTMELMESNRKFSILLNNSFNIVWELNCLTRQLVLITPVTRERFGIDDCSAGPVASNEEHFLHEDILFFREMLNRRIAALADSDQTSDLLQMHKIHVKNRDGSVVEMLTRSTLEKDDVGQYTLYGVSQRIQNNEFC